VSKFLGPTLGSLIFAAILIFAIVAVNGTLNDAVKQDLFTAALPYEKTGTAAINLDALVPGEWAEVLIVCRGVTPANVDAALGFHWEGGPSVRAPGFAGMLVFSTGTAVESYANFGQDKFVANDLYVFPCVPGPPNDMIAVLDRHDSVMVFSYQNEGSFALGWVLADDYFESLTWKTYG
jgi:hypothetical protein